MLARCVAMELIMKYALVDGVREEAKPKLLGSCIGCGSPMIPKCGTKKLHHWAHKGRLECDHWWEPETQWHRDWKNQFPAEWQESRHYASDGELHIADVKTASGMVIEFQYSAIRPDERVARETFYGPQMAWIVSGSRLKRDLESFHKALFRATPDPTTKLRSWFMPLEEAPSIVQRWAGTYCGVFLDFGEANFSSLGLPADYPLLWQIRNPPQDGFVVATPLLKQSIVGHFLTGAQLLGFQPHMLPRPRLSKFDAYMLRKMSRRPRF